MSDDRTKVVLVLALAGVAVVALIVAIVITNTPGQRAALGVATACVAVLATIVSRLGKPQ